MQSSTGQPQHGTGDPAQPMAAPGQWSTGLCDCYKDCSACCLTYCCSFITFGQIAEIVDKGTTSCVVHGAIYIMLGLLTGCACVYSFTYRSKLRQQYNLAEKPCNDFLVHCCCESCALCQEYRELKHREFKSSLGWEGNLARHNQGVMLPPIIPGEMER
ncbi:protein PLANT CADMIUM RESISTANCE 3-like [Bidens hawaiensis]|uniref:protein PLANT CADMIUM RESISTANCE 3-like n=1 Tax=Bidens hawaiensis TaxID=980011 RepID=UPI004049D24C